MLQHIVICGAGTMGGGIAISCLTAGLDVTVIDTTDAALDRLRARVAAYLARQVDKGRITALSAAQQTARLTQSRDLAVVSKADLLIEAVFEEIDVKRTLFRNLAAHLSEKTLVATNTSALRVADLATALPDPTRFLGLHYFSPAEVNPLVEVVSGPLTSAFAVKQALAFVAATGKTALKCSDSPGFAVNRFFCPYTNEAVRILQDGLAEAGSIDAVACESLGLALGPFAVMNIIKPRINLHAVGNLAVLGDFYKPARLLRDVGEADSNWQIAAPAAVSADLKEQIADRLRASLFLPVLEALGEGVAGPDDFDLGARLALRFGQGPVAQMRSLGSAKTRALVEQLCSRHGSAFPEIGFDRVFNTIGR